MFERGIDLSRETVRFWWNRYGPMFAADIRWQRVSRMKGFRHWNWHLDEMYVKIGGEMHYLWRAVDQEGEILESFVTRTRDKKAALAFIKKALKRHGSVETITTDGLRSYGAALDELGNRQKQEIGRWANNRGREQPPAPPTTRAGDAPFSTDEVSSETRFSPCLAPQSLRNRMPPRRSPDLQADPLGRTGRVAVSCRLKLTLPCPSLAKRRRVAIGLTAPFVHALQRKSCRAAKLRWITVTTHREA